MAARERIIAAAAANGWAAKTDRENLGGIAEQTLTKGRKRMWIAYSTTGAAITATADGYRIEGRGKTERIIAHLEAG